MPQPLHRSRRPLWPALLLRLTTARWKDEDALPPDLRAALLTLRVQGWRFRRAGPRNHAVWTSDPALQHRLQAVVLPDGQARLSLPELDALLRLRLQPLIPDLAPPDEAVLHHAHQKLQAALAPEWLAAGRPLQIRTEAGCPSDRNCPNRRFDR